MRGRKQQEELIDLRSRIRSVTAVSAAARMAGTLLDRPPTRWRVIAGGTSMLLGITALALPVRYGAVWLSATPLLSIVALEIPGRILHEITERRRERRVQDNPIELLAETLGGYAALRPGWLRSRTGIRIGMQIGRNPDPWSGLRGWLEEQLDADQLETFHLLLQESEEDLAEIVVMARNL